jgi:hypothetical protein
MELACKKLYIFSCGNRCHARFIGNRAKQSYFIIMVFPDNNVCK